MRPNIAKSLLFITLLIGLNCVQPSSASQAEQLALLALFSPGPGTVTPNVEPETIKPQVRIYNGLSLTVNFSLCANYDCDYPWSQDTYFLDVPPSTFSDYETLKVIHGYISIITPKVSIPRLEFPGSKTELRYYTCTVTYPGGPEYKVACEAD